MNIEKTWTEIKDAVAAWKFPLFFRETETDIYVYISNDGTRYYTIIEKEDTPNADQVEFDTNYRFNCNKPIDPKSDDGKKIVKAESRPLGYTTVFVGQADSDSGIGNGKVLTWDFGNDDDEIPAISGYKKKRLEFRFFDSVRVKEGTVYYHNVVKGSYIDFYVVCPKGQYYYDNAGTPKQATEDTIVSHYVVHHPIQGTVPMGDELNTESCSSEIPSYYKFWVEITVPANDVNSNGAISLEIYRKRTVVL